MKVKIKKLADQKNAVIAALKGLSEKAAKEEVIKIRAFVDSQYGRTLKYWNASGENNKQLAPKVEFQTKIIWTGKGHQIIVKSNIENKVWNFLDKGTPDIIQPKKSPPIKERVKVRTFPNTLDVNPFPGFTGKTFVIHAGKLRRGINPRRWTFLIGDEVHLQYKSQFFNLRSVIAHGIRVNI